MGQVADLGDLPLACGRPVTGRLVDESGQPVAAAGVLIEAQPLGAPGREAVSGRVTSLSAQVRSDDEGRFELSGAIALGRVQWLVHIGDYELARPQETTIEAGESPASVDLVVRRRPRIDGVVVDTDGQPVAGVRVLAQGDSGGSVTSEAGTFALWRRQPEQSEATVLAQAPASFEPPLAIDRVPWHTSNVRIVLRRTVPFSLEVVAIDGEPIEDFGVVLDHRQQSQRRGLVQQREHHPGGRLAVQGTVRGQTTLRVLPTARTWTPSEPVRIGDEEPLRITLQPRIPCTIRLLLAGEPLAGAVVQLVHRREGGLLVDPHGDKAWVPKGGCGAELVAAGTSDARGEVALLRDQVVEGRLLRIQVEGRPEHVQNELLWPRDGSPLIVDLPALGHIAGRIELRDARSDALRVVVEVDGDRQTCTPQPDGTFVFRDLRVGRYPLSLLRSPGTRTGAVQGSERMVDIAPGETTEVRFDLADFPLASVRGQVVASAPLPEGLVIDFVRRGGGPLPETFGTAAVAADGSFQLADLLPGSYLLGYRTQSDREAWLPGLQAEPLVLAGGEETAHRLPFQPRRLVVRCVRPDGTDADGVQVRLRCGGELWPAGLGRLLGGTTLRGPLVLDPAPVLPIELRHRAEGSPWSEPVVMPPGLADAEVTVVLPEASR